MFNKFKQKIADGVEGVSAGRQTPLRAQKRGDQNNTSGEVGRAQAQNNGRIEDTLDSSSDTAAQLQNNSFNNHPLDENYMTSTPLEISQEEEPVRPPSSAANPPQRSNSRQRRLSSSSNRSTSSVHEGYGDSDMEGGLRTDNMSFNELREVYRKQDKSLRRYKQKFSELVDAYKGLQLDKGKLEGTLTNGQDKQLRRIKELRETIELEQESKRHLEEALRLEMSEKDDQIDVLKTQVTLLKTKYDLSSPAKDSSFASNTFTEDTFATSSYADAESHEMIQSLKDKIQLLNAELEKLTIDNEQAHATVLRSEQEKKTAIEGVMNNMHEILNEQEDLRSEVAVLREELKNRDITIMNIREEESNSEVRLKGEFMEEMRETILAEALKQQEAELQTMFEEKESQLKNLFADKVHDLQRVMEENEKQKQISLHQKDSDVTKKNDEILILKEQMAEWNEKESKLKAKVQKIISEKEALEKRFSECQQQVELEKTKCTEANNQHTKQQKEKLDESNDQLAKVKRTSQTKVYEAQDQLRKKTNELNELVEKHKTELDTKVKESTQFMQSEHAKASRKLEVKISDMKKMIKELRQKLSEREGKCNQLESTLLDAQTEVDQAKCLNTSLVESEQKVGQLSCDMELMVGEVEEWKEKYQDLDVRFNEISLQHKSMSEQLAEKETYTTQLLETINQTESDEAKMQLIYTELEEEKKKCLLAASERDDIAREMQEMMANVKEEEGTLQNELNNLKTKFSYVEEESKELTQQLHNKLAEIELLSKTLDEVNKELSTKNEKYVSDLANKTREFNELQERYNHTVEERQQLEYKHDEKICELEEAKCTSELKLKQDYELKLQEKDKQLRTQLNKVLGDKDSSVEVVTAKLEDMRKQELMEMETRHEQQLNEIHSDLNLQIDNVEKKHQEFVKQNEIVMTKMIADKDTTMEKLKNDLSSNKLNEAKVIEELTRKENELTSYIDELTVEHKDEIKKLELSYKGEIKTITSNFERDLDFYKTQLESVDDKKCNDFNEITKKHTEDRNILLKQIEVETFNINQMKLLCEGKDQDYAILLKTCESKENNYAILSEKYENLSHSMEQLSQSNEHQLSQSQEQCSLLQTEFNEKEKTYVDKQQNLEKKFKKIISDRDKKNKVAIEELQLKHSEEMTSLQITLDSKETDFTNQISESENQIDSLKRKHDDTVTRLQESCERYESELSNLKSREKDAWEQLEQSKTQTLKLTEHYEGEIALSQSKLLEDKSVIEELKVKLMSGESTSKEIDSKFHELLVEKSKLEQKIATDQHTYEDKTRSLENEINNLKCSYDENIRKLQDQLVAELKCFEKEKSELLLKSHEGEEVSNGKLLELKKKAEIKISKLKKENSENINELETHRNRIEELQSTKSELLEKVLLLEARLEEQQIASDKRVSDSNIEVDNLSKSMQDYKQTVELANKKLTAEKQTLKEELAVKSETITELTELLDNATVVKMAALKRQKTQLDEEHGLLMKKLDEDNRKQIEIVETKLTARIDEKDFEHNSEVKQLLKEFQSQLGGKDMEIQQAIQDAIEVAQKDERRIIKEYDEQIMELNKELRLREQDMLALQDETQVQIDLLYEEREGITTQHAKEFEKLEKEYHQQLEDVSKRHEEALLNLSKNSMTLEEAEAKMNTQLSDMEQKFALQTQEHEEGHRNDVFQIERKYKNQVKQAKVEMRKLLADKGVTLPNGGEHDGGTTSNNSSDNEMDHSEVIKLKEKVATMSKELLSLREREKCLAMQAENAQNSPTSRNDRPATLHLSDSLNESVNSPPKSPQPLEFEYLRNILYNYMMGKQRKQMAKVLTAIVHFTPTQVQQILAKVEEQETTTEKKSSSWL